MATLFTRREANAAGVTDRRLERAVERGRYFRLTRGVYFKGDRPPHPFEWRLAKAMRTSKPVTGELAAGLHGFDGFDVPQDGNYANVPRAGEHETLLSIAATTTDVRWEWALEWALRKQRTTIAGIQEELTTHRRGNGRIRRVLSLRPQNAPPTGSVLETMTLQLIRQDPRFPIPSRQVEVLRALGSRPAFVDLAWPDHGMFLELDGEQHKDQPRYDATRQTAVVAATGWLVGRYTWTDVVHHPKSTLRSLSRLFDAAQRSRVPEIDPE